MGIFIYPYKLYLYLFILLSFDRGLWPEWHESKETERRFPGQKGICTSQLENKMVYFI